MLTFLKNLLRPSDEKLQKRYVEAGGGDTVTPLASDEDPIFHADLSKKVDPR